MENADSKNVLGRNWAGNIYGTNQGNIFVELTRNEDGYSGILRLLDRDFGICLYSLTAKFDGLELKITGKPTNAPEGIDLTPLTATANLNERGQFHGKWITEAGTGGTFVLFPHDSAAGISQTDTAEPSQLFTKRVAFKAVEVSRGDLEEIAGRFEEEMPGARVIVTTEVSTAHARYLQDFKAQTFRAERAKFAKIFISQPEGNGLNRILSLEFGQSENFAFAQSSDESWAIGRITKLQEEIAPYERSYATSVGKLGIGVNQILFLGMLAYIPSLSSFLQRSAYVAIIVLVILAFGKVHQHYIPNALIKLTPSKMSWLEKFGAKVVSWTLATITSIGVILITNQSDWIWNAITDLFK